MSIDMNNPSPDSVRINRFEDFPDFNRINEPLFSFNENSIFIFLQNILPDPEVAVLQQFIISDQGFSMGKQQLVQGSIQDDKYAIGDGFVTTITFDYELRPVPRIANRFYVISTSTLEITYYEEENFDNFVIDSVYAKGNLINFVGVDPQ